MRVYYNVAMSKKAIVAFDGRQFSCAEGDKITVNRLSNPVGDVLSFGTVIAGIDGDSLLVADQVEKGTVQAVVKRHARLPKVTARKYRRRKSSRSLYVHRQPITEVEITAVTLS